MYTIQIPPYPRLLSLITLAYGIAAFLWLTPEDSIWLAAVFGTLGACVLAAHTVFKIAGGRDLPRRVWFPGVIVLGGAIGAGATLVTAVLMLIKTSLHSHLFPDYPLTVLLGILARAPVWAAAGALAGFAIALLTTTLAQRPRIP